MAVVLLLIIAIGIVFFVVTYNLRNKQNNAGVGSDIVKYSDANSMDGFVASNEQNYVVSTKNRKLGPPALYAFVGLPVALIAGCLMVSLLSLMLFGFGLFFLEFFIPAIIVFIPLVILLPRRILKVIFTSACLIAAVVMFFTLDLASILDWLL